MHSLELFLVLRVRRNSDEDRHSKNHPSKNSTPVAAEDERDEREECSKCGSRESPAGGDDDKPGNEENRRESEQRTGRLVT